MCAILICCFVALKHLSVCTRNMQRKHQAYYPHSRTIWTPEFFSEYALFSQILFFNSLHSPSHTYRTNIKYKTLGEKFRFTRLTEIQLIIFLLMWNTKITQLYCGILNQNALQAFWLRILNPGEPPVSTSGDRLPLHTLLSASHLHALLIVHTNAYINLQGVAKPYLKPFLCCSAPLHQHTQCKLRCLKFLIKIYQAVSGTKTMDWADTSNCDLVHESVWGRTTNYNMTVWFKYQLFGSNCIISAKTRSGDSFKLIFRAVSFTML